ncbi:hypothetical protein [Streptomyces sp. NPDC051546]|uniref:hypothetical protein n=1 Tax=Streptomyces sp. NPDC051546 TaxID=3365655 RepID=UPI0037A691FD
MAEAPMVDEAPAELTWGSFNVFAYTPSMPGIAYRVLHHLLGEQKPGGLCQTTEVEIAEALKVHRSQAGRGLLHLGLARMVNRKTKGLYQLNHMLSGFRTPAEHKAAIDGMAEEDWLDVEDYQERYDQALARHEEEVRLRTLERKHGKVPTAPGVADLSAARRRGRR